jgi:hypothetical protein
MSKPVMNFIEADIPVDLTLGEWRRSRGTHRTRGRLRLTTFVPARGPRPALRTA